MIAGDWHLSALPGDDEASKSQYVHCGLRDLSSLCQTFSRLAPLLEFCTTERVAELVRAVAVSLVLTVKFLATKRPYQLMGSGLLCCDEIQADLVETFAQTLSALRGLLPWAVLLKIDAHIVSLVEVVGQVLLPVNNNHRREPPLVRLASAGLLLSITTVLRPPGFLECVSVRELQRLGIELCCRPDEQEQEDRQAVVTFYKAVCNSLLLPWHSPVVDQRYEERAKRLEEFWLGNLGAELLLGCQELVVTVRANGGEHQQLLHLDARFLAVLEVTLGTYKQILDHFADATTTMKQMLVRPLKRVIEAVLEVFKVAPGMGTGAINSMFGFLFSCVQVVQLQLGNQYIKDMLGVLLNATLATSSGGGGGGGGGQSVEQLLQILCLIVKSSHGSVQQVLLPSILELALDHIVPHLGNHEEGGRWAQETDITTAIFTLFDG